MLKKRAEPNILFVFHPERDSAYVHSRARQNMPSVRMPRVSSGVMPAWLGDAALLSCD
jgi:hypothetical protein